MLTLLVVFQILLSVALVVLVLLQHGKGADAGAAFGAGASGTVFGARGSASFLSRTTAIVAALFFINSLLMSTPWATGGRRAPVSVTERVGTAPAKPAPAPASDLPAAPEAGKAAGKAPAKAEAPAGTDAKSKVEAPGGTDTKGKAEVPAAPAQGPAGKGAQAPADVPPAP